MRILPFLSLLVTRPADAYGRFEGLTDSTLEILTRSRSNPVYQPLPLRMVSEATESIIGTPLSPFFSEPALVDIEKDVRRRLDDLPSDAPFPRFSNGDFNLARLCYSVCRLLRPRRVIETGVCYGVTTAFLLQALQQNTCGQLDSIDLPPLGKRNTEFVGIVVPSTIRSRWKLHRGTSKRKLPLLLRDLGSVDLFIHDSLHTYRNMRRELTSIMPYLSKPSFVISDDIECNHAFDEWVTASRPRYFATMQEENKSSLIGIAIFDR